MQSFYKSEYRCYRRAVGCRRLVLYMSPFCGCISNKGLWSTIAILIITDILSIASQRTNTLHTAALLTHSTETTQHLGPIVFIPDHPMPTSKLKCNITCRSCKSKFFQYWHIDCTFAAILNGIIGSIDWSHDWLRSNILSNSLQQLNL